MPFDEALYARLFSEVLSPRLTLTHIRGATATTTDALLLAAFLEKEEGRVLELCAGVGIVSLLAASHGKIKTGDLCEYAAPLASLAEKNIADNHLSPAFRVLACDARTLALPMRYRAVFANPPYRPAGQGRPASDPLADAARFERAGGILEFARTAAHHLTEDGSFSIVFPHRRQKDAEDAFCEVGLTTTRRVTVYPYRGGEPKLVLLRAERQGAILQSDAFYLARDRDGTPTRAAELLYREGILLTEGEDR